MKSKISIMFFGFWFGAVIISCLLFFLTISWLEKSPNVAWHETLQILNPTLFLACQMPSLGFLWHSAEGEDQEGNFDRTFWLLPTIYGFFIGIMAIAFYYA